MAASFKTIVSELLDALETTTGLEYLQRFVLQAAGLFQADTAIVAVIDPDDPGRLRSLAACSDGCLIDNPECSLTGSAGAQVIESASPCIFRSRIREKFPSDPLLRFADAFCYTGVPLFASSGKAIGVIALLDRQTIDDDLLAAELLQMFADRIVAEVERMHHETDVEQYQQRLAADNALCNADLKKAQDELEALGHAVSHDLRGPLRAIAGFSEILISDYGDELEETAASYLHRIRTNVRQMDELLCALLALSRITRHSLCLSQVDLSRCCSKILARLQQREPQRRVAVDIEPGLHARCDAELITVALEHLLDNAWRHTGAADQAHIAFSADRQQDVTVYCLADNGSGFDMTYADKLFEPFQRLHGQQQTIGVGLAAVKRVIERHGGRIWAQAAPGAGASFFFTLGGQSGGHATNGPDVSAAN